MVSSGFILDRQMVDIIKKICEERSIVVRSFSDDWILELSKDDQKSFVYGYRFGINSSSAEGVAQDKVATYQVLDSNDIPAVPHVIVSTRATSHDGWKDAVAEWGRFIVKPLHGGGGRGLRLFSDVNEAVGHMEKHPELEWCVSPFLDLVSETRLILLDGEVLLSFEKQDPQLKDGIPMFNIRLGAKAVNINPDEEIQKLAKNTQFAISPRLTAVDIVRTMDDRLLVLELNDGFSLEHYLRQHGENHAAAVRVYERVVDSIFLPSGNL